MFEDKIFRERWCENDNVLISFCNARNMTNTDVRLQNVRA